MFTAAVVNVIQHQRCGAQCMVLVGAQGRGGYLRKFFFQIFQIFTAMLVNVIQHQHCVAQYMVVVGAQGGGREIVSQIGKIPREGRQSQVSPH